MSKSKFHVDRRRGQYGRAYTNARTELMVRANKHAPVTIYYIDSPTFVVYRPKRGRKGGTKV